MRANVCRHRMMRLVEGRGNARKFTCPYHAWTYNTEGRLVSAPYMDRTTCFERDDLALVEVRCEIYQGWIYVTLDPISCRLPISLPTFRRSPRVTTSRTM